MTFRQASERVGQPPKTVRYYEDIGRVSPARDASDYRRFSRGNLQNPAFLSRTR